MGEALAGKHATSTPTPFAGWPVGHFRTGIDLQWFFACSGGEGGIRTLETVSHLHLSPVGPGTNRKLRPRFLAPDIVSSTNILGFP